MFELPTSITIDEKEYNIRNKGDFRMVLDCFSAIEDTELDKSSRIYTCLIIFYDGMTSVEDVLDVFGREHIEEATMKMFEFINCGSSNSPGASKPYKVVNWEQDQQLIASAINSAAKVEVRALDYLHWWTFMGYYLAIGESAFSNVVSIRDKMKSGKKLEKYEKDFKRNNPQYFVWDSNSLEQKQIEQQFRNLWNNGGQ